MTSTARIPLDRFRYIDEIEWQDIARASRPRTVADVELDLLRAHGSAASCERQIREFWSIRRVIQKRNGMARLDGWGKSERNVFLIKSTAGFLRHYRGKVEALNGEIEAMEGRS